MAFNEKIAKKALERSYEIRKKRLAEEEKAKKKKWLFFFRNL